MDQLCCVILCETPELKQLIKALLLDHRKSFPEKETLRTIVGFNPDGQRSFGGDRLGEKFINQGRAQTLRAPIGQNSNVENANLFVLPQHIQTADGFVIVADYLKAGPRVL